MPVSGKANSWTDGTNRYPNVTCTIAIADFFETLKEDYTFKFITFISSQTF